MKPQPKIEFYRIRNISSIISDTISFIKANFKSLFSGLFYICSPAFLITIIAGFIFFSGYFQIILPFASIGKSVTHSDNLNSLNDIFLLSPYLILTLIGSYITFSLVASVSFTYVKLYKDNLEISTQSLWQTAKRYIWKIIGAHFLVIIVSILGYLLCISPFILLLSYKSKGLLLIFLSLILIFIFLIAFIYFYIKSTFFLHFIIVEDKNIFESFKLSFKFTKHIFWKVLLSLFILGLFSSICGYIFQIPGMFITYLSIILGITETGDNSFIMILGTALTSIGVALAYSTYSIIFIGISFIYFSIMEERYGIKSKNEIDSIGKPDDLN